MLACSAMVACTNEDPIDNGSENPVKNGKKYYAAVNLAMSGNNSSRAAEHIGFADGEGTENEIKNATFFFLDANGNSCADAYYVAEKIESDSNVGDDTDVLGSFDQKTSTLIVMENPTEVPSSIVVLINVDDITGTNGALDERASLDDIKNIVENYAAKLPNGMVMSNSTYVDVAKNVIVGAPVGIENIITDEEFELGDVVDEETFDATPVTIYVEKVLAKVTVSDNIGSNTQDLDGYSYTIVDENGATTSSTETFTVAINNWWLDSTPTISNLLKEIENYDYEWDWNSISNYRSYWANSYVGEDQTYENHKYNSGVAAGESLYVQENTTDPTDVDTQEEDDAAEDADNTYDINNRTKVVVAATLKDSQGNAANMVKWYGKLYSKDAFLITLANLNDVKKYYIKSESETETTYTSLTKENLELVWNEDLADASGEINGENQDNETDGTNDIRNYEAVVTLTEGTPETLYTQINGNWTEVTKEDADNAIRSISKVPYWNDGKTYYWVELQHIVDNNNVKYYGVVRNHLYKVNLTGLKGLGTPVPNPDKIIIPETPGESDMETYISANMIIQAYRVVSNDVILGE